ncbi:MAG: hypothetical protein DLM61_09595 [Pseudonocardiales bacterium]|nr:DUF305 domain-containing protein [Pseudonocardiales bacterium]PZS30941.1 MAG: hypothetical protein DLM61_09595 [Pseudonocardiales bacterium]
MQITRAVPVASVVVALGLALGGCGSTASAPNASSSAPVSAQRAYNDTDVRFTQHMLPHHMQAVRNADIELAMGSAPEVKAVAQKIRDDQQKEIATMQGFLQTFGASPTSAPADQQAVWDKNTSDLRSAATPQQRDVVFLTNMVPHHSAAVPMAQNEVELGKFPAAQDLAKSIKSSQRMQIVEMNNMVRTRTSAYAGSNG